MPAKLMMTLMHPFFNLFCSFWQAFCIYMLATSFAYFLFLYIDIRLHVHRAKLALEDREARHQLIEEYISKLSVSTFCEQRVKETFSPLQNSRRSISMDERSCEMSPTWMPSIRVHCKICICRQYNQFRINTASWRDDTASFSTSNWALCVSDAPQWFNPTGQIRALFFHPKRVRDRSADTFVAANQLSGVLHMGGWSRIPQLCIVHYAGPGHSVSALCVVHPLLYRQVYKCDHQRAPFGCASLSFARNRNIVGTMDFHDSFRGSRCHHPLPR